MSETTEIIFISAILLYSYISFGTTKLINLFFLVVGNRLQRPQLLKNTEIREHPIVSGKTTSNVF